MKNRLHLIILAAMLGASLVPAAHATPIYSTLGPGNTFDTNGFVHSGPVSPPTGASIGAYADEFTSPVTATVGSVSLALLAPPGSIPLDAIGPDDVIIAIHTNTPTGPGGILGTFTTQTVPSQPGIVTFSSSTGILLVAGTDYWLSVGSTTVAGGTDWFLNNQSIDNFIASRESGQWTIHGDSTALAFSVNAVPEPGSAAFSTMALAAAYLWRKRSV